jgi:hypothetical protein
MRVNFLFLSYIIKEKAILGEGRKPMKYEYSLTLKIIIVILIISLSIFFVVRSKYEPIEKLELELPINIIVWGNSTQFKQTIIEDPDLIERLYIEISSYNKIRKYKEQKQKSPFLRLLDVMSTYKDINIEDVGSYNAISDGILNRFEIYDDGTILFDFRESGYDSNSKMVYGVSRISKELINELLNYLIKSQQNPS